MKHLYCWNQPNQQNGSLVNNSDFLELSAKVEDLQNHLGLQFTFEDVSLNEGETLEGVITNPETNKIYIVQNGNDKDNDTYNEYVYRIKDDEEKGSFELIGSGSFAQFQAHVNEFSNHISEFTKHIKNLTQDRLHVTSDDKNVWNNKQDKLTIQTSILNNNNPIASSAIYTLQNKLNLNISSINNKIETIKTQIPVGKCEETDNTIDKKSFAIGNCSYVGTSTGGSAGNEIESGVAIGNAATATRNGEISICGSLFNWSENDWSKVELLIGTGQDVKLFGLKSGDYGDGTYVTDKPYLEIRVSDGVGCGNPAYACWNPRVESVKIPIKKVFDILMEYGGVYKNEGLNEGEYWDDEEDVPDENLFKYPLANIIENSSYIPNADAWATDFAEMGRKVTVVSDNIAYGDE